MVLPVLLAVLALASACGVRGDAPLVDSHGRATTLGAFKGKVIVLSDVMTLCQESCPIITASMVSAAKALDRTPAGRQVEFVSLTIDPTRDDGRHLGAYQRQFPHLPNWTVLTGSPRVVDQVWRTLGVWRHVTRLKPPLPRDWVTGRSLTTDIADLRQRKPAFPLRDGGLRERSPLEDPTPHLPLHGRAGPPQRLLARLGLLVPGGRGRGPSLGAREHTMRTALVVALVAALCAACSSTHGDSASSSLGVGTQVFPVAQRAVAPRLSGTTITGTPFDLTDELGHGLVAVNVWASWCGPCRQEMPVLAHAAGTSLQVVGIDERDSSRSAQRFASSRGADYPSLADPDGKLLARLRMLPQTGVPSTVFLDPQGRVAARVIGPLDRRLLGRVLRQLGVSS